MLHCLHLFMSCRLIILSPFTLFLVQFVSSAPERIKAMGQVLSVAREQLYDCKLVTGKLRAMLQSADEQVRLLKKQSTFLSQLAAKTIPNAIHCLSMRLTIEYYLLPPEKRQFPRRENLENPNLYHYALFSDNVLAASVVVNSTVMSAKVMCTVLFYSTGLSVCVWWVWCVYVNVGGWVSLQNIEHTG
jgi:hypothetical protein